MPRIEPVPKFFPSTGFEHETKKSLITMLRIEPTKITMLRIEHETKKSLITMLRIEPTKIAMLRIERETFSIAMPRIEPVPKFFPSTGFEHETKKSSITMLKIESTKIAMPRIEPVQRISPLPQYSNTKLKNLQSPC